MQYKFRNLFNREDECTIDCDELLNSYDDFSVSMRKVDINNKSYSYDNIDCTLKCVRHRDKTTKIIELDKDNFDGYLLMLEKYKEKTCLRFGKAFELITENNSLEGLETTFKEDSSELRNAFEDYLTKSGIKEMLFQCFLSGVNYERRK